MLLHGRNDSPLEAGQPAVRYLEVASRDSSLRRQLPGLVNDDGVHNVGSLGKNLHEEHARGNEWDGSIG